MPAESVTHHFMWCDDCRCNLYWPDCYKQQQVYFDHEDTMYDQAKKQGWYVMYGEYLCPDCQEQRQHEDTK